eukprot:4409477-Pyramimonas_sp.AAC.1
MLAAVDSRGKHASNDARDVVSVFNEFVVGCRVEVPKFEFQSLVTIGGSRRIYRPGGVTVLVHVDPNGHVSVSDWPIYPHGPRLGLTWLTRERYTSVLHVSITRQRLCTVRSKKIEISLESCGHHALVRFDIQISIRKLHSGRNHGCGARRGD